MMKIKLVELKEDDPIFKGGFIISTHKYQTTQKNR